MSIYNEDTNESFDIPQNGMIDFYADWCQPCKVMNPTIDEIKKEGYEVKKVDVETNQLMANYFGIANIPTFVFIKEGKEYDRITGVTHKDKILSILEEMKS